MIRIPFDVNDDKLRAAFLDHLMPDVLAGLTVGTRPLWGNMTAQHMLEHLLWAFQCSTGKLQVQCRTPEAVIERVKRFLFNNSPTPRNFRNPLLGETPPPLHFPGLAEAREALRDELNSFVKQCRVEPGAVHVHPVFGPLDGDQWHRSHFKHCYHHMLQFGLIEEPSSAAESRS